METDREAILEAANVAGFAAARLRRQARRSLDGASSLQLLTAISRFETAAASVRIILAARRAQEASDVVD